MGLTISGAYGRDYTSKAAATADWNAGKDFVLRGLQSGYINREDWTQYRFNGEHPALTIRYAGDRKMTLVSPKPNGEVPVPKPRSERKKRAPFDPQPGDKVKTKAGITPARRGTVARRQGSLVTVKTRDGFEWPMFIRALGRG